MPPRMGRDEMLRLCCLRACFENMRFERRRETRLRKAITSSLSGV